MRHHVSPAHFFGDEGGAYTFSIQLSEAFIGGDAAPGWSYLLMQLPPGGWPVVLQVHRSIVELLVFLTSCF